ncbi:MAG: choice-of-anchor I family protein [Desulfamplus sp.]|nr:choice-of-anchor I family protein [Desulfamplus sp.]
MSKKLLVVLFLIIIIGAGLLGCNDGDTQYPLTINFEGDGSGTVVSEEFGINSSKNSEYNINEDKKVTIKATTTDSSIFVGWSGDCTPDGQNCVVTMDKKKTVTATYAKKGQYIALSEAGRYETGSFAEGASEITAYDPETGRIFVVNGKTGNIDILDSVAVADSHGNTVAKLEKISEINLSKYGKGANSVAFKNNVLAAAVENNDKQANGKVVFFDAKGNFLNAVTSGALPDMVKFSPDGKTVLAANEGEPNSDYTNDPEGSITIVDISKGVVQATSTIVGFTTFNSQMDALKAKGVRFFGPGSTVAQDIEPEYIAVSPDSKTAWITLQENNALAELNIETKTITRILPFGYKDHSMPGNGIDASDKDGKVNIRTWPVLGMYLPDSIVAFEISGQIYLATANEGDSRDYDGFSEEARIKDVQLDPAAFPEAASLQQSEAIGRLKMTTTIGDTDNDGDYDKLFTFGARSFTIWKPTQAGLERVFDSGDDFETTIASMKPELFNVSNDSNNKDDRSDDKGPEPEGIDVGVIGGRTYIFVGLERVGGIMVYDVTIPINPSFVTYLNTRDVNGDPESGTAGDLAPEGVLFVKGDDSVNGKPLVIAGNEVSGTTTIYSIDKLQDSVSFAVFSDPHYYDTSLGTSGSAFESYLASDRKLLLQSGAIIDSVVENLSSDKDLDFVIVSGDLTKDGELVCHQGFANYLKKLENSGIKVFVTPGNHDINNPHAHSYQGASTNHVDTVSPEVFAQIYADFGYSEAVYRDSYSLSYVAEPVKGIWVLSLDSCDYNDNESLGKPVTSGKFSSDTLAWITKILGISKSEGKTVIATMHHGLLEHFTGQSVANPGSEYVVENWATVSEMLAKEGLNIVFTGHFHANDMTSKKWDDNGVVYSLTDVETGSLVTYPNPYRVVHIDSRKKATIQTRYVQSINYDTGNISFTEYSKNFIVDGLETLAFSMFTAPAQYGGYGLSAEQASVIAPQFADAFVAHYEGDETPDTITAATINAYLASSDKSTQFIGASLISLWTDLPPRDSSYTIDISSND